MAKDGIIHLTPNLERDALALAEAMLTQDEGVNENVYYALCDFLLFHVNTDASLALLGRVDATDGRFYISEE